MNAPLPETRSAVADDTEAVKQTSTSWGKSKKRVWIRGALLAALICTVLFAGWYSLTNINWRTVEPLGL